MSKNGVNYKGVPKPLIFRLKFQGAVVDWNTVDSFELAAYTENSKKLLASFEKSNLIIDDPTSGVAVALFTAAHTGKAVENELYIVEWKVKIGAKYGTNKGYWCRFAFMYLANKFI